MWNWDRWKEYGKPGGVGAVVCGIIAAIVAWSFDLGDLDITLSAVAGYLVGATFQWMNTITNGLWRIEEKLDDIESKLDDLDFKLDNPNDRSLDTDL